MCEPQFRDAAAQVHRAKSVERSRVDPTPLRTRRIDPPAREQGYPRQGTNMVTNPSEKIVTNPAHYGGIVSGREEMSVTSLPAAVPVSNRWTAVAVGHGNENLGRGTHGENEKPAAPPAVVPT